MHAHPLSLHLPSPVKLQCTLQLSGQIHWPCFISSKNTYSVDPPSRLGSVPSPNRVWVRWPKSLLLMASHWYPSSFSCTPSPCGTIGLVSTSTSYFVYHMMVARATSARWPLARVRLGYYLSVARRPSMNLHYIDVCHVLWKIICWTSYTANILDWPTVRGKGNAQNSGK
jgi:hypothetical protein